ncbi:MAG: acyltransferase [Rhodobacteraceae bacterium]|nr:acyltransferase [Paracoccaceae bacterium]
MAYYTREQLLCIGLKSVGENVRISDKASIYDAERISIGSNVRIDDFCIISGRVEIGDYVLICPYTLVAGGEKGVFLNDFSCLSYHVKVFSQSDDYLGDTMTNSMVPKKYKTEIKEAVTIGRHVIVGAGSVVFPGVDIRTGCSVGAMTLVTKSTEPWGVYAGIPARRVKERKKGLLELEKQLLAKMR